MLLPYARVQGGVCAVADATGPEQAASYVQQPHDGSLFAVAAAGHSHQAGMGRSDAALWREQHCNDYACMHADYWIGPIFQ